MQCPSLDNLPFSPHSKNGWPWNEESPLLPNSMPNGRPWPKISIVTPSLNQGQYIEETIRSVLLQGYPNLEYIIIDGGSTDNTIDIIRKYERWITYWVSEPDRGQAHAINKGFAKATGEIFAYINSDDFYEPRAFKHVAILFLKNPDISCVAGGCRIFGKDNTVFNANWPDNPSALLKPFGSPAPQPSFFFKSKIYKEAEGFNEDLHYVFDREFYIKIAISGYKPLLTSKVLSRYRYHEGVKTDNTIKIYEESIPVIKRYGYFCGLNDNQIRKMILSIQNDITYLNIFSCWKKRGRIPAIIMYILRMLKHPSFINDRKVLGLARRLIFFPASAVEELKNL